MVSFFLAFILIIILVYPSLKIIVGLAGFVNKNFSQDIPIVFNLLKKSATGIIKGKHTNPKTGKPYANVHEIRLATISSIGLAGLLAALITNFSLLLPIVIWVIIISVAVNFVDY